MAEEKENRPTIHPPKRVVTKSAIRVVGGIERNDMGNLKSDSATTIITFEREKGAPLVLELGNDQRKELLEALKQANRCAEEWEWDRRQQR